MTTQSNDVAITITGKNQAGPALQGIAQALAQLGQQASQTTVFLAQIATALSQVQQAQTANAGSTNQLATAYIAHAQAIQEQTQAYAQAQAAALAFRQQQAALAHATQEAAQQARAAGAVWQQMFAVGAGLGLVTSIQGVTSALGNLGKQVIETGRIWEGLRTSLAAVTGGHDAGARALAFTTTLSDRLGVSTIDLTTAYKNFAAATRGTALEGERTQRLFENLTIAGRVLGSSNDQITRAFLALQQMVSKGVVSMEELRGQLGEAIPGVFQVAARAMGVTTAALQKIVETGTLDAIPFAIRLGEQFRKEVGGGAEDASKTAGAAFQRLWNEWDALLTRVAARGPLRFVATVTGGLASLLHSETEAEQERQALIGPPPVGVPTTAGGIEAQDLRAAYAQILKAREALATLATARLTTTAGIVTGVRLGTPEEIAAQQNDLRRVREYYAERLKLHKEYLEHDAQVGGGRDPAVDPAPFATLQAASRRIRTQLEADLATQTAVRSLLPDTLETQPETAKERQKLIEKAMDALGKQLKVNEQTQEVLAPTDVLTSIQTLVDMRNEEETQIKHLEEVRDRAKVHQTEQEKNFTDFMRQEADRRREIWKTLDIFGLTLTPEEEEALKERAKAQHERIQAFAKTLDIFGLDLAPELEARIKHDDALLTRIREQVDLLRARPEDRPEVRLGQLLAGIQDPERRAEGAAVIGEVPALKSAKAIERIYQQMGRGIEQTFAQLWENIFRSGELSAQEFGLSIAQSLQRMFAQLSLQLLNQLLNSLARTTDKEGGWGAALAQVLVAAGSTLFSSGAGAGGGGGAGGDVGSGGASVLLTPSVPFARGGITPALQPLTHAGLRMRHLQGFQPMAQAFARGGITPALDSAALAQAFARTSQTAPGVQPMPQAFAHGGITPALDRYALATALARVSHTAPGFAPLALARGGIVDRPSFALIGEQPGRFEAVVPLPDNKSIPVTMTPKGDSAPAPPQNIMFELHISFKDAIDPRSLRRSDGDIVNVVARDITNDGIMRRVLTRHAR